MNRGSILHNDLTYTMLHEMVMKKFNLEASYPLNLSAKPSLIEDNFDIPDDYKKYMSFKPYIPETPLYKSKTMISKDYKKETNVKVNQNFDNKAALDLAIRLKALDEGYQILNDRSAPDSVESVNACTVVYWKLPMLNSAETYRAMVQDWYYKRRKLAENMTYEITDWAANKVQKMMKSAKWVVCSVSVHQYQVYDGRYNR
nr:transposase, MuDR, MULE transposase domain protein [Tanacetum cinerariifolium]